MGEQSLANVPAAGLGSVIVLTVLGLLLVGAWVASLAWVWRDADGRGQPGFIVAVLVALLCWPVSLIVWLLARPAVPGTPAAPSHASRGCLVVAAVTAILLVLALLVLPLVVAGLRSGAFAGAPGGAGGPGGVVTYTVSDAFNTAACREQLKQIARCYRQYVTEHGSAPKSFADLREFGLQDEWLRCPAARLVAGSSYRLCGGGTEPTDLIIIENLFNHSAQGGHVVFGDGRVEWTGGQPVSPRTVAAAIAKQLPPQLATARPGAELVKVGRVAYSSANNSYHAEVFWKTPERSGSSVMRFASQCVGATINDTTQRISKRIYMYCGEFPIAEIAGAPSDVKIAITVDAAMESPWLEAEEPLPAPAERTPPPAPDKPATDGAEADDVPAPADPAKSGATNDGPAEAVADRGPTHWRVGSRRLSVRIEGGVMRTLATNADVSFRDGKLVELPRGGVIRLSERGLLTKRHAELRNSDGTREWWIETDGTWRRATPKEEKEWMAVMEGMDLDDHKPEVKLREVAAEKQGEFGLPAALQTLAELDFDSERTALLLELLDEKTLSGPDQAAIVEAVCRDFDFDSARERVLLALVARPDLASEAKRAIADGVRQLDFDSSRKKVLKALLKKTTKPAPAAADGGRR